MRFVLACLALAGCTDPASRFVGTWTYYNTQVKTSCSGQPDKTSTLTGTIELTHVDNHTIAIDTASQYTFAFARSGDCSPHFTVTDMQADLVPLSCMLADQTGTPITVNYETYQLTLVDVTGPGLAPMTPGLGILLQANVSTSAASCTVTSDGTVVTTPG
jgi:hypothetical protein